ncbi:MAG: EVE domain-containing protein [Pirellulales bacterium]|nr:EVE domain-containing protein [Pirellulales bacterium]
MSKSSPQTYRARADGRHLTSVYEPRKQAFWLWVTKPKYYLEEDGSDRKILEPRSRLSWTCDRSTHKGDLILLYRAELRKDIAYLIEADSDARPKPEDNLDGKRRFECDCHVLCKFSDPLSLKELRSDPDLRSWYVLRRNLQYIAVRIDSEYWQLLLKKLAEKNPISLNGLDVAPQGVSWAAEDETEEPTAIQTVGGGLGDTERNKQVEESAIAFVTEHYRAGGWNVVSVEQDKCGYDLRCTKAQEELHVEVKGLSGDFGAFNITAGEVKRAENDPFFVLCVVACANSSNPNLNTYTGCEFLDAFDLRPIQFRALPHTS